MRASPYQIQQLQQIRATTRNDDEHRQQQRVEKAARLTLGERSMQHPADAYRDREEGDGQRSAYAYRPRNIARGTQIQHHSATGSGEQGMFRHAQSALSVPGGRTPRIEGTPAMITYGKRRRKLLPLTGQQFRGRVYNILSDNENDDSRQQYLMAGGLGDANGEESRHEPVHSNDSDDGYRHTDGHDSALDAIEILQSAFFNSSKKTIASKSHARPKTKAKAATTGPRIQDSTKVPEKVIKKKQSLTKNRPTANNPNHDITPKQHHVTPARRLPINELFLVASPPNGITFDPVSTHPTMSVQDPITASSSSPLKRSASSASSNDGSGPRKVIKTPFTDIRKRCRATRWRYKSIVKSRQPAVKLTILTPSIRTERRGRDGFEASELAIYNRPGLSRKTRAQTPLIPKFDALQLGSGPLPDVEFESPTTTALVTQLDAVYEASHSDADYDELGQSADQDEDDRTNRRVSFDHRALEKRIRAELSSISAPPRPRSVSDSVEDAGDYSDEDEVVDDAESDAGDNDAAMCGIASSTDIGCSQAADNIDRDHRQSNVGVTLDFRRPEIRGQRTISRSLQRGKLIEINEHIVEVPDTSPTRRYTTQRRDQPHLSNNGEQQRRRTRSILKNSTSMVPDSTSAPEHTEANTRRNSMVEVKESRYFTSATNNLHHIDLARRVIMPRRQSSYFNYRARQDIEIPASDHVVPETSPQRLHYTDDGPPNMLRRTSEVA